MLLGEGAVEGDMADDGRAGKDQPLTASVVEQLREKAHLDEASAAEARASERQHERVARRKAEEQETVLQHTGGERRLRPPRAAVAGGAAEWAWIGVAGAGAALAGVGLARRGGLALLLAGVALVATGVKLRRGPAPLALA
jgi:hypothetical protein